MKYVLICEDEVAIRDLVAINLQRNGYTVLEASSGEEALSLYEAHKDDVVVALLDVMLPGVDGFTLCRLLRQSNRMLGIMMLTARTQEIEKVNALKNGADDYVTKPFSPSELMARVEALYRRVVASTANNTVSGNMLTSGVFALDFRTRQLLKNSIPVELTQVEFQMMHFFFENEGEVLTRSDILLHVWGKDFYGEEKIVDVNIRRLRMKIENDPSEPRHLLTVWGRGYQWNS